MRKKIILLLISTMLLINTAFAFGVNTNSENLFVAQATSDDVPTWEQDDYWTYEVEVVGNLGDAAEFDLSITDLTFTVSQVQSDRYKINIDAPTGTVQGQVSVTEPISVSGSITNAAMDGTLYLNKSDLAMRQDEGYKPQVTLTGKLGITSIDIDLNIDISRFFSSLRFPMSVGNEWSSPENLFTIHYDAQVGPLHINDQSSTDDAFYPLWIVVSDHIMECTAQDTVTVPFGVFKDSYKIEWSDDPNQYIWYSPDAKNFVKAEFENLEAYILFQHLSFILVDSNYLPPNDPPETPETPDGETNGYANVEYEYETSGTDPDTNNVKYGFDWDGDDTVDSWTDFVSSGQTGSASHTFTTAGTYNVTVKSQDTRGAESGWSSALSVTINENSKPDKPDTPSGPSSGGDGATLTYTSKTSDADDDELYYMFDWGDGSDSGWLGPEDSDVEVSSSHSWSNRRNYNIKVRAKDEHGALSEWSDSLPIEIPKYRFRLKSFFDNYPIIAKILSKFLSI